MKSEDVLKLKLFGLNTLAVEAGVRRVVSQTGYSFGRETDKTLVVDEKYFPQFEQSLRLEAEAMAAQYRVFYCLENSIRSLVTDVMLEAHGDDWWNQKVPDQVKVHVAGTRKKELESGVSQRSQDQIDYTTFGELGEIIKSNWSDFTDVFQNLKALEKVISTLNVLRGPIAHCKPLAEDEVLRLHISVRDWFRAMG